MLGRRFCLAWENDKILAFLLKDAP
ncbi:unnamed protein product, partial [Rotaria sp. Silwood1]